jgi:oxygen-dependent protoporphyrinogen oxidase
MGPDSYYDAVVLATPANIAGALLEAVDTELAQDLLGVAYSSSVTVALGYYMNQLGHLPPGFGFLVPRSEGTRMLACTFVHNKFPHRTPPDKGLLRCFLGGARDEAVLSLSDDELLAAVRAELKKIIKLDVNPIFARVYRWRGAMAQYESGHLARVERIERRVADIKRLDIAGNAFHGIGVPDCIRSGQQAADRVLGSFAEAASPDR